MCLPSLACGAFTLSVDKVTSAVSSSFRVAQLLDSGSLLVSGFVSRFTLTSEHWNTTESLPLPGWLPSTRTAAGTAIAAVNGLLVVGAPTAPAHGVVSAGMLEVFANLDGEWVRTQLVRLLSLVGFFFNFLYPF